MRGSLIFGLMASGLMAAEPPLAWRTDYTAGRKEAADINKPVCLVIGGDNCFYCKKLESVTLADSTVAALLKNNYVAIKLDGAREAELVKALKVELYPTTVLASADGNIHAIINGFVPPEQMREHLKRILSAIAEDNKSENDYKAARAAFDAGDAARAAQLLRGLTADNRNKAMQAQAKELLEKADRMAATRAAVQAVRPQALLDVARQLHDGHRLADAMDVAAEIVRAHPNSLEAKAAAALIEDIRTNPDKLRAASRQADEKAAVLQLALSESLMKRGDTVAAKAGLEQVIRLTSTGPTAEAARIHLTKLKQPTVAIPATLKK